MLATLVADISHSAEDIRACAEARFSDPALCSALLSSADGVAIIAEVLEAPPKRRKVEAFPGASVYMNHRPPSPPPVRPPPVQPDAQSKIDNLVKNMDHWFTEEYVQWIVVVDLVPIPSSDLLQLERDYHQKVIFTPDLEGRDDLFRQSPAGCQWHRDFLIALAQARNSSSYPALKERRAKLIEEEAIAALAKEEERKKDRDNAFSSYRENSQEVARMLEVITQ